MSSSVTEERLRPRMAVRQWLRYLISTTADKWEQEWELEQLSRLQAEASGECGG